MAYENANYSAAAPYNPLHLLADDDVTTRKVTLLSGAGALVAGTVLGAVLAAAAATVTPGTPVSGSGGTVGNGARGTWTADAGAMAGTWRLVITAAASNGGTFEVVRPDGTVDGVGTVAVAYNGGINGTLADGSADWVVNDVIPIVVSYAGPFKYLKSVAAATDGSQVPDLILAQAADATSADVEAIAYESGVFVATALTLGAGHTIASIREALRDKGILIDD